MPSLTSQKGFNTIGTVLAVAIIIVIGLIGWKLYDRQQKDNDGAPSSSSKSTTLASQPIAAPDGYTTYANTTVGFSFAYPQEYGSFTEDNTNIAAYPGAATLLVADQPAATYSESINGTMTVVIHKENDMQMSTRKYGPTVTLKDGKWINTDLNMADATTFKVGDEYKDLDGKAVMGTAQGDTTIYIFKGGDEGCVNQKAVFVASNRLVEIRTPESCDESVYGDGTGSAPSEADKALYTAITTNVPKTIKVQ